MSEHYCMYKDGMCELDIDEAYQQGRADAIKECIEFVNGWDSVIADALSKNMKEQIK